MSGRGIVRIHEFLIDYSGSGPKGLTPEDISGEAARGTTPSCVRAVQIFLSILGSVAGDFALAHGAKGGVWFAGGIIPQIANLIDASDLATRFSKKGIVGRQGYLDF